LTTPRFTVLSLFLTLDRIDLAMGERVGRPPPEFSRGVQRADKEFIRDFHPDLHVLSSGVRFICQSPFCFAKNYIPRSVAWHLSA